MVLTRSEMSTFRASRKRAAVGFVINLTVGVVLLAISNSGWLQAGGATYLVAAPIWLAFQLYTTISIGPRTVRVRAPFVGTNDFASGEVDVYLEQAPNFGWLPRGPVLTFEIAAPRRRNIHVYLWMFTKEDKALVPRLVQEALSPTT